MHCKLFLPVVVLAVFSVSGCMTKKEPPVDPVIEQSKAELRRAQVQVEQQLPTEITEEKAKQLAARHMALKQAKWGDPIAVRQDDEHFYLSYETPEKELRLIGSRVMIVDKESGVVTVQKRR